ncbi:cytochrome c3 family protein [Ferrimonas lipolytica]|uniref:Cytochrome c3 family protein n=1 Tax=Ferrimonas lipolytica TaxID=2724191 RepID=A0A6H1UDJ7_9GAMM|nr:cytochrome c3 family protein [Ferrimonas lipolytica]QIZ76286.1 cytochrome c3 family protein [Ferrimonas lipolytica]
MKTSLFRLGMASAALLLSQTALASDDCAGECHIIKPYVASINQPNWLAGKHVAVGLECIDCHEQDEQIRQDEQRAYAAGEYDDPMWEREFEDDFCLRCHEGGAALIEATQSLHHKWNLNPHENHQEAECYLCHNAHRPSTFICSECHHAEWEERLPEGWEVQH